MDGGNGISIGIEIGIEIGIYIEYHWIFSKQVLCRYKLGQTNWEYKTSEYNANKDWDKQIGIYNEY